MEVGYFQGRFLTFLVSLSLFSSSASAQEEIARISGTAESNYFGQVIAEVGDLNDDGVPDFAAAAPESDEAAPDGGVVRIISGNDWSFIRSLYGAHQPGERFGDSITSLGDVNGDGYNDIAVGSRFSVDATGGYQGRVYLFSGKDGSLINSKTGFIEEGYFGRSISAIGDINGDGVSDYIIGEPAGGPGERGAAHIFSGSSGEWLRSKIAGPSDSRYGGKVCGLGDLNGDSIPDYAVGAFAATAGGPDYTNAGAVYVYSGADHSELYRMRGRESRTYFGFSIERISDFDGDGVGDFMVGAVGPSSLHYPTGYVEVYSGADGSLLQFIAGQRGENQWDMFFGVNTADMGDLNDDGLPDYAVGVPNYTRRISAGRDDLEFPGQVIVFSGADRSVLYVVKGENSDFLGISMAAADMNGDGYRELLIGADQAADDGAGYVSVYRFRLVEAEPEPTPSPAPDPAPAPGPEDENEVLTVQINAAGNLSLTADLRETAAECSLRIVAAKREARIAAGRGRAVARWSGADSDLERFIALDLPSVRGRTPSIWFGLQQRCDGGNWELLDRSEVDFGVVENELQPVRVKRLVRLIRRAITRL